MNTKNDSPSDDVELIPSFADKCREMEKVLIEKLLDTNLDSMGDTYTIRMVKAMQALHALNKHR